jgi:hypothetical protein
MDIPMSILNVAFLQNSVSECLADLKSLQTSNLHVPECTLTPKATLLLIISLVTYARPQLQPPGRAFGRAATLRFDQSIRAGLLPCLASSWPRWVAARPPGLPGLRGTDAADRGQPGTVVRAFSSARGRSFPLLHAATLAGEPSPGADLAGVGAVPAQMWQG